MTRDGRDGWRGPGLALIALGAAAALFFSCFERSEVEVPVGGSSEARRNPYLALQRVLSRMQHPVREVESVADLMEVPDAPGTLWLLARHDSLPPERAEALLDWVAAGGHLVVTSHRTGPSEEQRPAPLLDPFGLVRVVSAGNDPGEADAASPEGAAHEPTDAAEAPGAPGSIWGGWQPPREIAVAPWPGSRRPLEVEFDAAWVWQELEGPLLWALSGESGPHLVMLAHGEGRVTALTDARFLENDRLAQASHAELALRLARWDGGRSPVWIVRTAEWPGLLTLAVRHAWPALAAGAALLAAWLWRASQRFGPLEPAPVPERRSWLEHLDAVGRYHWRQDRAQGLLRDVRARALQRLAARHPGWARVHPDVRDGRLAELTGLSAEQVGQALREGEPLRTPLAFVTTIAHLERIRAAL